MEIHLVQMNDPGYMVVQSLTMRNTDYNEETYKKKSQEPNMEGNCIWFQS
jgi:hypothetical protein